MGLEIDLFGPFRIAHQGQLLHTVDHPREQSLLAYLLLHADTPFLAGTWSPSFGPRQLKPRRAATCGSFYTNCAARYPSDVEVGNALGHDVGQKVIDLAENDGSQ